MTWQGNIWRTRKASCPGCQRPVTGSMGVDARGDKEGPAPGDLTVCAGCGAILAFTSDYLLREVSSREVLELEPEEYRLLKHAGDAVRRLREKP
jgi:hypothetical protein